MEPSGLIWILFILAIVLIIWFIKVLKRAVRIKAIRGFKDKLIIAFLFFIGIIFAIIYLKSKINQRLDKGKPKPSLTKEKAKGAFDRFWFIVWKDDSFKGWILSILFIFIFIKFIFFPILSFATGTALPLAIVESCSMYHDGPFPNFDEWWESHEGKYAPFIINDLDFKDFIFTNGFNKGDILFVIKANPETLEVGDIIIFNGGINHPIIHRIIYIKEENGERTFSTIGDNNHAQIPFEKSIKESQLVGKALFKVTPFVGWGKLIFFEHQKSSSERGFCK